MTTNRRITLDLSWYVYPAFKLVFLSSYIFCYNEPAAELRLKFPHVPCRADLGSAEALTPEYFGLRPTAKPQYSAPTSPDFDYMIALIEPDTVVNMRYGVLFLLALSSLSVYSIILAG